MLERGATDFAPAAFEQMRLEVSRQERAWQEFLSLLSRGAEILSKAKATCEKAVRVAAYHVSLPGAEAQCAEFARLAECCATHLSEVVRAAERVVADPSDAAMRALCTQAVSAIRSTSDLDEYWDKNLARRAVELSCGLAFSDPSGKALDRLLGSLGVKPTAETRVAFHHVLTRSSTWQQRVQEGAARFTALWFPLQVKGESARLDTGDQRSAEVQKRDVSLNDESLTGAERWGREPQQTPEEELEAIHNIERVEALFREAGLSRRQHEVALAVARGDTLADAARDLGIASADARRHWGRAGPKLREAARRLGIAP